MSKQKRKCHRMDKPQEMCMVWTPGRVGGKGGDTRRSVRSTVQTAWCLQRMAPPSVWREHRTCGGRAGLAHTLGVGLKAACDATRCPGWSATPRPQKFMTSENLWRGCYSKESLYRCNPIKTRSYWMRVGPGLMTGILLRREGRHPGEKDGDKDRRHVSKRQETRWQPPEARRDGFSHRASRRSGPANTWILDFRPPELKRINFCRLEPFHLRWLFKAALGNEYARKEVYAALRSLDLIL